MNDNFLTLDEFLVAMQTIESAFQIEKRLPEQVFKRQYQFYLLHEFDSAMEDLLKTLNKIRSPLTKETVLLSVLDADPIKFFWERYKKIYAFYFPANISPAEYFKMLWVEPYPADDPFPFHTELEVYIPDSFSWAMWGERSAEIAVIGLDDPALVKALIADKGWWMDAETASDEFVSMPFIDQKVPEDFRRALIANYGSRADLEQKLGRKVEYPWEKQETAASHG